MKICPKCAAENAETAKFCNECGTALEVKEAGATEKSSDAEPVPKTQKIDSAPEESVESLKVAESTGIQESIAEQTQNKAELASSKKKRVVVGIVAAALICLILYISTRPKLESLDVTYSGDQQEGIVLDDDNSGISVVAHYSNGKTKDVRMGEWHIQSPKTLKADSDETVVVTYKNSSQDLTVSCTTTKIVSAVASYNGPQYEGTVINQDSDFTVTLTYGDGHTETYDNTRCRLDPSEVKLKAGEESKIKLILILNDGSEGTADFSIIGKEKIISDIKIEGDHYNCSANQLKAYLESKLEYGFSEDRQTKIGDSYFYRVIAVNNTEVEPFSFEVRENVSGKVNYVAFTSNDSDIMTGLNTSISLARALGGTMKSVEKNDMTFQMFMISKMHISDDTLIECYDQSDGTGYVFYIMPQDYKTTFWEEAANR